MSEKTDKFSKELAELVDRGEILHMAMLYESDPDGFKDIVEKQIGKEKFAEYLKKLPNFGDEYQTWYSKAQAVVKQILPERIVDFNTYYEYPRVRKEISPENYMIKDALQGLEVRRVGGSNIDSKTAVPAFVQQLNILKAAQGALTSRLMDLKAILQADLFDSEIESARSLAKAGYMRASGAICGVVIEKHLLQVCTDHSLTIRKKNPGLSDLNQALRDNDTITVAQWRFNQHLADIRNTCDHSRGREPTKEEIEDLLDGAEKVLKTIF